MIKDFKLWHNKKFKIHNYKIRPYFHIREVWFCSIGANIGFEQDGSDKEYLRPVLVVRKFNNEILWALPLTKNNKKGKYYCRIRLPDRKDSSTVILSQIRLVDAKRLQYKLGTVSYDSFLKVKKRLKALLD